MIDHARITTSRESRLESLLGLSTSWEVLLWKRADRSVIGIRVEVHQAQEGDEEIYRISLRPLWQVRAGQLKFPQRFHNGVSHGLANKFQVVVDHRQRRVAFGPMGNILLNPQEIRGCGLGSYAFSLLIRWLHQRPAKDYAVQSGFLSGVDAKDESTHRHRDQFYSGLGFDVHSDAKGWGSFYVSSAAKLRERVNPRKITEAGPFPIATIALSIIRRLERLRLLRWRIGQRDEEIERLCAERDRAVTWNRRLIIGIIVLLITLYLVLRH